MSTKSKTGQFGPHSQYAVKTERNGKKWRWRLQNQFGGTAVCSPYKFDKLMEARTAGKAAKIEEQAKYPAK